MIKTLRRKFIAITMVSVVLVLFGLIGTMDILNYYKTMSNIRSEMSLLKENGGDLSELKSRREEYFDADLQTKDQPAEPEIMQNMPPEERQKPEEMGELFGGRMNQETPFSLRYFTVTVDDGGEAVAVNTADIFEVDETKAAAMALEVFSAGKTSGFYKDYYYDVIDTDVDGTACKMYLFLNSTEKMESFRSFRNISFFISMLGIGLVFVLVVLLSKIATRPVAESYEKQKHFITDASHEIKTPLAIIEANTEVLEITGGDNEWIKSIRNQIARLTSLTEKLVFLSRMDEENTRLEMQPFSLSKAVSEVADSFLPVAKARNKTLDIFVEENVSYTGNEDTISQAVSLLLDNALKYTNENGRVEVHLKTPAKNKKEITVFNTVDYIEPGNHDELFERFYRQDESRSAKTGGHGIGLSVVKAIVTAHKGKVSAVSRDDSSIIFRIVL